MDISKLEPTSHHRLSPGYWKCIGIPVLTLLGIYSASIPLWNSRFLSCSSIKGTGSSSSFSRPLAPVKLGHIKRNQAAACLLLRTQLDLPAYVSIVTSLTALDIRRPLVAVRGSAPRKLLQKIVVERWGTWRWRRSSMGLLPAVWACRNCLAKGTARMLFSWPSSRRLPTCLDGCCFAWLGYESCCCSSVSKALLHGTSSCCVGLSEPLRQRHRAQAFLEGCLQRLLTCLDGIL